MKKFSQRELLQEGFASNLLKTAAKGTTKLAGKAYGAGVEGLSNMISPTANKLVKKAGKAVSDSFSDGGSKGKTSPPADISAKPLKVGDTITFNGVKFQVDSIEGGAIEAREI